MPKRTQKDICELHAITRDQMNYAKSKGVNIYDDGEMMAHLKGRGGQGVTGVDSASPSMGHAQTLEEIEYEVRSATDRATAQLGHEKLKALQAATKVRINEGELIPRGKVREDISRCVTVTRAELMKLPSDYAGRLAGLTESKVQKELRTAITAIMDRLSVEAKKLFPDHP